MIDLYKVDRSSCKVRPALQMLDEDVNTINGDWRWICFIKTS
jgi:hypothetical protein